MFVRPSTRMSPSSPVVWSKWPWLHTMASIEPGSMSSLLMLVTTPSGLVPASKRNRCSRPALATVTSTEKPCSAISTSGAWPPAIVAAGRLPPRGPGRRAGPWSGMKMSVTLSMSVVTTTESTGSSSIWTVGSVSCSTAGG